MQLLVGQHGAPLEIVAQAERVADLVHDRFLDGLVDQVVGHLVAGLGQAAPGNGNGGHAQLVLHLAAALADALLDRPQPGRARIVGAAPGRIVPAAVTDLPLQEHVIEAPAQVHRLDGADRLERYAAAAEDLVLVLPETDHVGIEKDVGVEDLAR